MPRPDLYKVHVTIRVSSFYWKECKKEHEVLKKFAVI